MLLSPEQISTDLVVLSHLRWDWVWQRPQHLVSRLARHRRTWFVEEPLSTGVAIPRLVCEDVGGVFRVRLEVPGGLGRRDFGAAGTEGYTDLLAELVGVDERTRDCWLYTPLALPLAESLDPRILVYDVMDDLASFVDAPSAVVHQQRRVLEQADVVFTGGSSLHRGVLSQRSTDVHLFPSGVELAHYRTSRSLRRRHPRPVAGYVGVVDERLDLSLLAGLGAGLPDWDVQVVGPVTKIDPSSLPRAVNLHYLGMQPYDRLPEVMSGFDVALMPFARDEATRSISPTKTLEYLAAGLPVVSTRVADVVSQFGTVVHLADDAREFAAACRHLLGHSRASRDRRVAQLVRAHEWDTIAAEMTTILDLAAVPLAGNRKTA